MYKLEGRAPYIGSPSIHKRAYLSTGVTSGAGVGRSGVPRGLEPGVPGRGYAGFWI